MAWCRKTNAQGKCTQSKMFLYWRLLALWGLARRALLHFFSREGELCLQCRTGEKLPTLFYCIRRDTDRFAKSELTPKGMLFCSFEQFFSSFTPFITSNVQEQVNKSTLHQEKGLHSLSCRLEMNRILDTFPIVLFCQFISFNPGYPVNES